MAYNLRLQTLDDLRRVKTTRTNYNKTVGIAKAVIENYGSFVVIDPTTNFSKVKIAREVEKKDSITQVKNVLKRLGANLNGMTIEFGNGSAGSTTMSAATTKLQENATLVYCQTFIETGKSPTFQQIQKEYSAVDDEWFESFDATAKALKKFLGTQKGYLYSRDKVNTIMPFLEKIAKDCCGVSTKDNWNPMDIVIVRKNKEKMIMAEIEKICTTLDNPKLALDALNEKMRQFGKTKDLIGISLKKVNPKRNIVTEWSDPKIAMAKKPEIEIKGVKLSFDRRGDQFDTGELSFDLIINGLKTAMQVRAFSGGPRERNQFDMTQAGASAKLGKVSGPLAIDPFLSDRGMKRFEMRDMPAVGDWNQAQIDYWVGLYKSLQDTKIDGTKIDFGDNNTVEKWEAMLKEAIADEPNNRRLASQLSSKLQSLYFLTNMAKFDANSFIEVCYYGAKKQYQSAGVFLKISD